MGELIIHMIIEEQIVKYFGAIQKDKEVLKKTRSCLPK